MGSPPTVLHLYRFTLEPIDGFEHERHFFYRARDEADAREQALADHGIFRVDGFGTLERVTYANPQLTGPPPHETAAPKATDYLTLKQAAAALRTSDKTIKKMVAEGRLTNHRLDGKNGRYRIKRAELETAMRPACEPSFQAPGSTRAKEILESFRQPTRARSKR